MPMGWKALVAALMGVVAQGAVAEPALRIGTAGVTGVYYPTGGAICRVVNQSRDLHGLRCVVAETEGSVANVAGLAEGTLSAALVQGDVLAGTEGLSTLVALHPEPFTILTRPEARMRRVEDLIGTRIALPLPGTGSRVTVEALFAAFAWAPEDFAEVREIPADQAASALCAGEVDAIVQTVGHPAPSVQLATTTCGARLLDITGPLVDALVSETPEYAKITIPGGLYPGNAIDVDTFATTAYLAAAETLSDATVDALLTAIYGAGEGFSALLPTLIPLSPGDMIAPGPAAHHPAAEAFYRDQRWLP